jgi:cysteine sulfinate desulfinase/cysteine desulfurase-like protein
MEASRRGWQDRMSRPQDDAGASGFVCQLYAAHAQVEDNKRIATSNLSEFVGLQKLLQGGVKILAKKRSNISSLQDKLCEVSPSLQVVHWIL